MSVNRSDVEILKKLPDLKVYSRSAAVLQAKDINKELFGNYLLKYVIDDLYEMVFVINDGLQVLYGNEVFLNKIGMRSIEDVLGEDFGKIIRCQYSAGKGNRCGTDSSCSLCGFLISSLASISGEEIQMEYLLTPEERGRSDIYKIRTYPLSIGGSKYVLCSMMDVGDSKRRHALERIFFHDVLNTANVVLHFADILKDRVPTELKDMCGKNLFAVRRLIEEILDQRTLLNAEKGELSVNKVEIKSLDLLQRLCSEYNEHPDAAGKTVEVFADSISCSFQNDEFLLYRVLGNMLKNALEATEKGEIVKAGCYMDGNSVVFKIHNVACMDENVQKQLFNRAFSTKGKGHGWGAYSMKLITERYLGGELSFTSNKKDGTTFVAEYPLA
ncbi:MAG: HAMP domain-containing histidine kinase [Deltaproteobacteria bacterium]|nr:HAMP domain-containing histidine kinase [Deltaproteobacteria bacterium]